MSDNDNVTVESSTGLSVLQGIIIFAILFVGIGIIIWVIRQGITVPYPISTFNYGDTVLITPLVKAQYGQGPQAPTNQYLTANFQGQSTCLQNGYMNANSCTLTFTGDPTSDSSKWVLNQFWNTSDPTINANSDANQSLTAGFGNRFYLQNKTYPANNQAGRARYSPFNSFLNPISFWNPWITMPTIGSTVNTQYNANVYYYQDLLVYFMPTTYPDIYYILFPGEVTGAIGSPYMYNNTSPNDGIIGLRPYAEPNTSGTYYPYDITGHLNPNGPILGQLPDFPNNPNPSTAFTNPEIFLFRVTTTF